MNGTPYEQKVREDLESRGWTVFTSGYPDFLCFKDGAVKFVEVKARNDDLRGDQAEVIKRLNLAGFIAEVIYQDDDGTSYLPLGVQAKNRLVSLTPLDEKAEETMRIALDLAAPELERRKERMDADTRARQEASQKAWETYLVANPDLAKKYAKTLVRGSDSAERRIRETQGTGAEP